MKTLFITNARSGKSRNHVRLRSIIERECGASAQEFAIEPCGPADTLDGLIANAIRDGIEVVVAAGGDGTVSEVGRRLIGTSLILGILPVGSGNGFARHLGIPLDVSGAIRCALAGTVATVDTCSVNGIPFLGVAGVGFDALVAERFASSTVRGLRTYITESLRSIGRYKAETYTIRVGNELIETAALLITVANSNQYGNDVKIAPSASLQDGMFDVTIVGDSRLTAAPMILANLLTGAIHRSRHVRSMRGASVQITRRQPGPAHIDGEPMPLGKTLDFVMHPGSLRVLVPSTARRL